MTQHRHPRPGSRRRTIVAGALGIVGGAAGLLVPTSTDVAVASFSNPATTTTTTLCPNGTATPMYVRTYYDTKGGRYVSVYVWCNLLTGATERGCHSHSPGPSTAPNPGEPSGTPSIGACPT